MNDKKIEELKKAIEAKKAELAAIPAEQEHATADAVRYATLEKKERRIRSDIQALQNALDVASYAPDPLTDQQELLAGLNGYQEEHNARLIKIRREIEDLEAEEADIEKELQQAAVDADAKKTLKLSTRRDEIYAEKNHLWEMLHKAELLPIYPEGAIKEEWKKICNELLPEWNTKVTALKAAADAYRTITQDLVNMKSLILSVRAVLETLARDSFEPVFTAGYEHNETVIEKETVVNVINLFRDPLTGKRI